jgi:hypothetical protein
MWRYARRRDLQLLGDLLVGWDRAPAPGELPPDRDELVDRLDHVHRDADRRGLVGHAARDRLRIHHVA